MNVSNCGVTHADLVRLAARWLRHARGCGVVLTERGATGRADALGWTRIDHAPHCILIECKRTLPDFKADKRKLHHLDDAWEQHPGNERFYFTPVGLLEPAMLPAGWGLLEWDGRIVRKTVKARIVSGPRPQSWSQELQIVLRELRIYHAQGITYRPLPRNAAEARERFAAREVEIREARQLMRLEARA